MTQKKVKRLKGPCCKHGFKGKTKGEAFYEPVHDDSLCFTKMLRKGTIRMRRFMDAARIVV